MTRRTRAPIWVLPALLMVGLLAGHSTSPPAAAPARERAPSPGTVLALLDTLSVKGRAPMTGYSRSRYGEPWVDVDHNGCRTRDDVLARDLTERGYRDRCVVVAGRLLDPYTHRVVSFRKADADQVQVDHVVALADAWQTGAQRWTPAQRVTFANDPLELLAVGRDVNQQKGSGDAATWLPPYRPFRCAYVTRQVLVKAKYRLWVTPAEREAIRRVLARCR